MRHLPNIQSGATSGAVGVLLLVLGALPAAAQDKKPPARPPTPVVVASVREMMEAPKFTYNGFLEPENKAIVSAVEPGFVSKVRRRDGEQVERGDVLAILSNPTLDLDLVVIKTQIGEAEAQLNQARIKLNRLETLHEKQLIPAEQYENEVAGVAVIEARKMAAEAQAQRLAAKLKMLTIRAPISGQIVSSDLEVGQWMTPNREMFQISNYELFELRVGLPGKYLNTIPESAPVAVYVPEIDRRFEGKIKAVIHHVDPNTGNFNLRIEVNNPKQVPLSGLVAHATVPVGKRKRVKVVPRDAIVRRGSSTQVVVVRKDEAQIVPVEVLGNLEDNVIVVAEALKAKEQVVVRGNERLFPGTPVKVTNGNKK